MNVLGSEWHISNEGEKIVTENGSITDRSKVLKKALDIDLKEIASPILSSEISKETVSKIVLQIQKIRNVSAPKANEDSQGAPRMLKFVLTDGDSSIQALELSTIPSISRDKTPPGSKIVIEGARILSGYLLLSSKNCTLLGGKVPHLFEKWELNKSIQYHSRRQGGTEGAPPWVNFGCKIQDNTDDQFKSLEKAKQAKEDSEFEQQRQGAIAEVASGAVRKVFGGRTKQSVQPVQNSSRRTNDKFRKDDKGKGFKSRGNEEPEMDEKLMKPSEKVSLFAFLEDKLPASEPGATSRSNYDNYTQNNTTNSKSNCYNNQNNSKGYQSNSHNNFKSNNSNQAKFGGYAKGKNNGYNPENTGQNYNQQNFNQRQSFPINSNYKGKQFNPSKSNETPIKSYENYKSTKENITNSEVNDLTQNMGKINLNNPYTSKILKQQLNLPGKNKNSDFNISNYTNNGLTIGSQCMAKYWEDGKYYNAVITAETEKTFAVQFKGYGNIEEVLKADCRPDRKEFSSKKHQGKSSMEFRRSTKP